MSEFDAIFSTIEELSDAAVEWNDGFADVDALRDALFSYLKIAPKLPFTDPETIRRARNVLGRAIIIHAYNSSEVYRDRIKPEWLGSKDCVDLAAAAFFVEKKDLMIKPLWYTDLFNHFDNATSGTTSKPFQYRIWADAYPVIERDNHYGLILKEFGLEEDARTLYVSTPMATADYATHRAGDTTVEVAWGEGVKGDVPRLVCGHGQKSGEMHTIQFSNEAFLNVKDYCAFVVDYVKKHKVNVVCAPGAFFELLNNYLLYDESNSFPRLFDLMSNTGDRVNVETLEFLTDLGVSRFWCDHMRCWDGGASFFTCKHGVYHVQDELAHCFTAPDGRLASIDYFSYPSPFINYLNGDYCSIEEDYQKCLCGRWYRKFKFHNRKPRVNRTAGNSYYNTAEIIKKLGEKYPLRQVSCQDGCLLVEGNHLTADQKRQMMLDMAKEQLVVQFFEGMNSVPTQHCSYSHNYALSGGSYFEELYCCWYTKGGALLYCGWAGSGVIF